MTNLLLIALALADTGSPRTVAMADLDPAPADTETSHGSESVDGMPFNSVAAWGNETWQRIPDRLDLEAALRSDGLAFEDVELVYADAGGAELAPVAGRKARRGRTSVAAWMRASGQRTHLWLRTRSRAGGTECARSREPQHLWERTELRLYSPPGEDEGTALDERPTLALGATGEDEGRVYAALRPGDQVMVVQARSDTISEDRVWLDRGDRSVELIRGDDGARLCTTARR